MRKSKHQQNIMLWFIYKKQQQQYSRPLYSIMTCSETSMQWIAGCNVHWTYKMYCTRSHLLACIYIRFLVIYHTSNKLHLTKLTTTYSSYTPTGRLKFTYMQSGTFLDHGSNLVRLHFPGMMKLLACQNSATKIRDVQRSKLRNEKMTTY